MHTPTISRPFEPGTTGWSAEDLFDPQIDQAFQEGAYEIVEGVLTQMPAALLDGSFSLQKLIRIIERHLDQSGAPGEFASEVDLIISPRRLARVDAVFLLPGDLERQRQANRQRGRADVTYGRMVVPPTLIIESLSVGHETHDSQTKRGWYGEWNVKNYWLLNAYERTLECLVLDGNEYRVDAAGNGNDELRPTLFGGLVIPLAKLWA